MSLFLFDTPPDFVQSELDRRRIDHSSSYKEPTHSQKPKSVWMRMTSGFKPDNEEKRRMLTGGDLTFEQNLEFGFKGLYERRSSSGEKYRPEPSITSISVDEKLQSFECSVEWNANSIGQLERLFPYFMNLGSSVIVDWGWDDVDPSAILDVTDESKFRNQFKRVEGDTGVEEDTPEQKTPHDTTKFGKFEEGQGRYCFVAGSIVDFSYSIEENGTYSCTTEIMSLSKAMRKLRTQAQQYKREDKEEWKPYLYAYLQNNYFNYLQENAENKENIVSFGQGNVNDDEELDFAEHGEKKSGYYVSWGEIERIVNTWAGLTKDGEKREPQAGPYENPSTLTMDSSDSIISNYNKKGSDPPLNLRTTDPLRCIVNVGTDTDKFRKFTETPDGAPDLTNSNRQGYLYNLYINYNLLKIAFQTHDTIFDALEYILSECSSACFGIWKFELQVNGNYVQVIDKNMPAEKSVEQRKEDEEKTFTFRPNTEKTVMRGFSFDTNLDDKMKAQIVAQKTQESDKSAGPPIQEAIDDVAGGDQEREEEKISFGSVDASSEEQKSIPAVNSRNDSAAKLFGKRYSGTDVVLSPLERPGNAEDVSNSEAADENSQGRPIKPPSWEKLVDTLDKEEVEERREGAKDYVSGAGNSKKHLIYKGRQEGDSAASEFSASMQADLDRLSPANGNNTLGMGATIELAGISGFTAFQVLDIKQIPKIFENNGVFSIESVSHSVSMDDWSTELKTNFIVGNLLNKVK